jgi:putative transposase
MSEKYKIRSTEFPYFVTFTVVRWIDVFTRAQYRNIFVDSLNYCIKEKGLRVHAWVLMTNHAHLLLDSEGIPLEHIVRDFKRHTSKTITRAIHENIQESRDWMMYFFRKAGENNGMNKEIQFWQNGYHPIHCWKRELIIQKLNYIHQNPVRAELVHSAHEWKYSSASDYILGHGLVNVEKLDIM